MPNRRVCRAILLQLLGELTSFVFEQRDQFFELDYGEWSGANREAVGELLTFICFRISDTFLSHLEALV